MSDVFTKAEFVAIFPDFATVDPAVLSASQAFMLDECSQGVFGKDYKKGVMLLTAHWLTLEKRKGNGQVTSSRVGDLSRSYQGADLKRSLDQTSWGSMFLRLARRKVGGPGFVGQSYPPSAAVRLPFQA